MTKKRLSKSRIIFLGILFLALLFILLPSNKLSGRFITLVEPKNIVVSRPIYREHYPTDFLWWLGGEYTCTKTNIFVTNFIGTKERIFSDNNYQGDKLDLFILSPDRTRAIGKFTNQTCGGADQKYSYFQYIDLFNDKTIPIIGKDNRIFDYLGNIAFSPNSRLIAYFNKDAMYVFDTKDGSSKKLIQNLDVKPITIFDTNEEWQSSELGRSPFITSSLDNGKYIYKPRRNLAWKDDSTIYYYFNLAHDPDGFYSVNFSNARIKKISNYTYEKFQQLKKQNTKHQLGIIEYPIEDSKADDNYQKKYCNYGAHYSFCQI